MLSHGDLFSAFLTHDSHNTKATRMGRLRVDATQGNPLRFR